MARGLALISVVVTVAILGILGARALSGTEDADVTDLVTPTTAPGTTAVTTTVAGLPGAVGAAEVASCATDRATLDAAVSAYAAMLGEQPATQQALVDARLLTAPVDSFELTLVGADVTLTGVGACAGQ